MALTHKFVQVVDYVQNEIIVIFIIKHNIGNLERGEKSGDFKL